MKKDDKKPEFVTVFGVRFDFLREMNGARFYAGKFGSVSGTVRIPTNGKIYGPETRVYLDDRGLSAEGFGATVEEAANAARERLRSLLSELDRVAAIEADEKARKAEPSPAGGRFRGDAVYYRLNSGREVKAVAVYASGDLVTIARINGRTGALEKPFSVDAKRIRPRLESE